MGRYKVGPNGVYYDANDTGPNQASADDIAKYEAQMAGGASVPTPPSSSSITGGGTGGSTSGSGPTPPNYPGASNSNTGVTGGQSITPPSSTLPPPAAPTPSPYVAPQTTPTPTGQTNQNTVPFDGNAGPAPSTTTNPQGGWTTQGGTVTLRGPDGSTVTVDQTTAQTYLGMGYKVVGMNGQSTTPPAAASTTSSSSTPPSPSSTTYQPMEGVDMNKMNDPSVTSPKYVASRILASGGTIQQAAAAIGATVLSPTTMRLSTGEVIDTRRDEGGANALQWLVVGGGDAGNSASTAPAGGSSPSTASSSSSGASGSYPGADPAVHDAIMQLLDKGNQPVSATDPNISGPTNAFKAQETTAARQSRAALAERAAQSGLDSGGAGSGYLDSAIQSQLETAGKDTANYQGNLMVNEIQARRNDVLNAIQFAQGEEKNALTEQLAQLNDQLQRAQMSQQNTQFYDTLGYNVNRDQNNLDYLMTQLLLQGA